MHPSGNVWHLEENTQFYASVQTFSTVQEGKQIIARHLLDKKVGNYPISPDMFNVSGGLFGQGAAMIARPDADLTVEALRGLFGACIADTTQVWNDIRGKVLNDTAQGQRDSFVFEYVVSVVPDLVG